MPPDCEINWKKHPTTIKGRHNFGKILDSSSGQYTGNMKLLLITIVTTCLATALALPSEKPKRGILPGDPRYGAEKVLLPSNSYGPPQYQPGLPLGGDYASPIVDARFSAPLPAFGAPDSLHIRKISSFPDVKTISTTTIAPPERFKMVTVSQALTSYGTPVPVQFKSILRPNDEILHTTAKPGLLDVTSSPLTTITHAPLTQEVTKVTEVKTAIPLKTTFTAQRSGIGANLLAKGLSEIHTNEFIDTGAYNLPTSIQTRIQPALETNLHPVPQYTPDYNPPLLTPAVKAITRIHPIPKTLAELPHTFTHTVKHVEPTAEAIGRLAPLTSVRTLETLTPAHGVETLPPAHTPLIPCDNLAPINGIGTLGTLSPIHAANGLRTYNNLSPAYGGALGTYGSISSVHAVKSLEPLHPGPTGIDLRAYDYASPAHAIKSYESYHPIHTASALRTYDTYSPLHTAPAIKTFEPLPQLHTAPAVKTFESIKTYEPLPQHHTAPAIRTFEPLPQHHTAPAIRTFEPLPQLHTAHAIKTFEPLPQHHTAPAIRTFEPLPQHHTAPAIRTFEPLPQLHTAHAIKTFEPLPQHHTAHAVKTLEPLPQLHTAHAIKTFEPLPQLHTAPVKSFETISSVHAIKSLEPLPAIHPVTSVRTYQPLPPVHTIKTIETVNRIQPIASIKSVETLSPIETLRPHPPLGISPVYPATTVATPVHSVTTVAPPVHSVTTVATPVQSVEVLPSVKTFIGNQPAIGISPSLRFPSSSGGYGTIHNAALGNVEAISVTPSTEHFQSTSANGAYIY